MNFLYTWGNLRLCKALASCWNPKCVIYINTNIYLKEAEKKMTTLAGHNNFVNETLAGFDDDEFCDDDDRWKLSIGWMIFIIIFFLFRSIRVLTGEERLWCLLFVIYIYFYYYYDYFIHLQYFQYFNRECVANKPIYFEKRQLHIFRSVYFGSRYT